MAVCVNGIELDSRRIERCGGPEPAALRELLLQEASRLGLGERPSGADSHAEDALIDALLSHEVQVPEPTEEECRRCFEAHAGEFRHGELIEVSHILFAVTPRVPVQALAARAQAALEELRRQPERFAESSREWSNCPSGAQGGNLWQIGRGDTVPEFEQAIFGEGALGVVPALVRTRYGFHIVKVDRRIEGRLPPFAAARSLIGRRLSAQVQRKALEQYARLLAGRATIEGADLGAAASPLLQ